MSAGFASWFADNWAWFLSLAFCSGALYWRLMVIERDVQDIKEKQDEAATEAQKKRDSDAVSLAATYARRDVLAETLQSINQRLGNIEHDLREVKARHVP